MKKSYSRSRSRKVKKGGDIQEKTENILNIAKKNIGDIAVNGLKQGKDNITNIAQGVKTRTTNLGYSAKDIITDAVIDFKNTVGKIKNKFKTNGGNHRKSHKRKTHKIKKPKTHKRKIY